MKMLFFEIFKNAQKQPTNMQMEKHCITAPKISQQQTDYY